jgi:hypothetical protein
MMYKPKLKVKGLGWDAGEDIRGFEEAIYFPFCSELTITVEGEVIGSYEDLVKLAEKECHRDKEFLEVIFLPLIVGG